MTLLMTLPCSDVISHARAHTHTPHIMFSATKYKDEQQNNKDGVVERLYLGVTLSLTSWELRNLKRDGKNTTGDSQFGSQCGMIRTN